MNGQPEHCHHGPEREPVRKGRFQVCLPLRRERIDQAVDVGRNGSRHVGLHCFGGKGSIERLSQLALSGTIGAEHGLAEGVFEQGGV